MRVLLVGYVHGQGGIQTHTRGLAEGLAGRGHGVCVLSPPARPEHPATPDAAAPYVLTTYQSLAGAVRAARRARPDVVVVAGTGFKAMLAALAAPRARRVFFEVMSGARAKRADPRLLVHLGFHAVVGQGRAVARRFAEAFGWRGAVAVIPALPEPLELAAGSGPAAQHPAQPGTGARCAYFGRLAAHKNVAFLVARWDDISAQATLDIWGAGPEADALGAAIAARAPAGRIKLCGRYPGGAAYIALLQSYDLTLLPTVGDEGAPLVLLESMAAGVPFVGNGIGGIADYANPDCAVTDGDIAGFVPAARTMLARLAAGDVDRARLQRHYGETFSSARLLARWEEFLVALCPASARPAAPPQTPPPAAAQRPTSPWQDAAAGQRPTSSQQATGPREVRPGQGAAAGVAKGAAGWRPTLSDAAGGPASSERSVSRHREAPRHLGLAGQQEEPPADDVARTRPNPSRQHGAGRREAPLAEGAAGQGPTSSDQGAAGQRPAHARGGAGPAGGG